MEAKLLGSVMKHSRSWDQLIPEYQGVFIVVTKTLENDFVMNCRIIQSDQNAQMAFHIHKALGYALDVSDKTCREFNV